MERKPLTIDMPNGMNTFLGVVVFAAGVALLTMDFWLDTSGMPELAPAKWAGGSVFALGGLGLLLYRKRVVIDADRRAVLHQSRLAIPLTETRESFGEGARVTINKETIVAGRLRGAPMYPVRIESRDGSAAVEVALSLERGRTTASRVAEHLGADVDDATG